MIVKLTLRADLNILVGYLNKNKSGEYFASNTSSAIFSNLEEIKLGLDNLKLKGNIELIDYEVISLKDADSTVGCESIITSLKSVVRDTFLKYGYPSEPFTVSMKNDVTRVQMRYLTLEFDGFGGVTQIQPLYRSVGSKEYKQAYSKDLVEKLTNNIYNTLY